MGHFCGIFSECGQTNRVWITVESLGRGLSVVFTGTS